MLKIDQLTVTVEDKQILTDISLKLFQGTFSILMGPNGSGKSSLAYTLMGHPKYKITSGSIIFDNHNITEEPVEKRARRGIFLSFQYPYHVPGVNITTFLHTAYKALSSEEITLIDFKQCLYNALEMVGLDRKVADRTLDSGFSGGEKKRLELAQLLVLPAKVAILDELDSGMDAEGIELIKKSLTKIRQEKPHLIILMITHNALLSQHLPVDNVLNMTSKGIIALDTLPVVHERSRERTI